MKKKQIFTGLLFGLIIGTITIVAALIVFFFFFALGGPPEKTLDVEQYEETIQKYTTLKRGNIRSAFICFPKTIPASAFADGKKPEFYFSYQNTWDDPTCEAYLLCQYDKKDYLEEVSRLSGSKRRYNDNKKALIRDTSNRFAYPVYMAINHRSFSYEYAMLVGNNTIAYIYTTYVTSANRIKKIPKEYLPVDFTDSLSDERGSVLSKDGYNIYQTSVSSGISYFSRNDIVKSEQFHAVETDDTNFFLVATILDENNTEQIEYTEFAHFDKNGYIEISENGHSDELAGMSFLGLDFDENHIVITYEKDGNQEKKTYVPLK